MTVDVDALIDAAREETRKPWPGLGITDELCVEQGLIVDLADALVKLRAERDLLKAVALRQVQYRKAQVARLTRERDEAVSEMHQRELHHFEMEQELAGALATIERIREAFEATPDLTQPDAFWPLGMDDPRFREGALWIERWWRGRVGATLTEKGLTMTQGEAND